MREIGSFLEFIKTGKIGKIQCGLTRKEIDGIMGEADECGGWGYSEKILKDDSDWWTYGLFMIKFRDNEVLLFGVYYTQQDYWDLLEDFIIAGWPSKGPSFEDFLIYVSENKLENSIKCLYKARGKSTERCIVFNSGVIVFGGLRGEIISFRVERETIINSKHWIVVNSLSDLLCWS